MQVSLKGGKDLERKDLRVEEFLHELTKVVFPLFAMGQYPVAVFVVGDQVSHLMHQGDEKSVFVEVMVNGNEVVQAGPGRGIITQATVPFLFDLEFKIVADDPICNGWHCGLGDILAQYVGVTPVLKFARLHR